MKIKKFKEKLTLNKKTIADLNRIGMQKINGGMSAPPGVTYDPGCTSEIFCDTTGISGTRPGAISICPGCK